MKNQSPKLLRTLFVLFILLLTGCLTTTGPTVEPNLPTPAVSPSSGLSGASPAVPELTPTPFAPGDASTPVAPEAAAPPTDPPVPTAAPTMAPPVRFAVIGDYGLAGQPAADVANLVKSWQPDFIITTGDNNYPDGAAETIDRNIGQYYSDFIAPYAGDFGPGATENRFFPTLGNHDLNTLNGKAYLDYFTLPGNERYYDFTWGPVHLFALNSDSREPDGVTRQSIQAAWLQERLASSTAPWKIVYMHVPPYSSGLHGSVEWMRWPFREWGATAVLSGHDHTYERLLVDGLPYFVNGVGGGAIYRFDTILEQSQVRYNADWGAMLVEATPERITFQFITRLGEVIDTVTIGSEAGGQASKLAEGQGLDPAALREHTLALLSGSQGDLAALTGLAHYTLQISLNFEARTFAGHAQVDYVNREDTALDRLYFRLLPNGGKSYGDGSLSVGAVAVDGQPAGTALSLSDTVLEVLLPRSLEPAAQIRIDLDFAGIVPVEFGSGEDSTGYGIYNYSEGVLTLANWYPILAVYDKQGWNLDPVSNIGDSVYSDMSLYTVDITAPSELVLVATGVETDRQLQGEETRYRFASGPVRDFFLAASPEFQTSSQTVEGIQVNNYYLPGDEAGSRVAAAVAVDSLQAFNQLFGPYPYTELDIVQVPLRFASGVEYPGVILIGDDLYEEPEGLDLIITTSHEVAHQWWYNLVGNDVFDDPWLDEALATYSSGLYYEQARGERAYQAYVRNLNDTYTKMLMQKRDGRVTESLAHFENQDQPGMYGGVVYIKGGLFFHEARQEIGEAAFFAALQAYYRDQKYQVAQVDDLLGAFETASGRELDQFFQTWLYSP